MVINGKLVSRTDLTRMVNNYIDKLAADIFVGEIDYKAIEAHFKVAFKKRAMDLSKQNVSAASRLLGINRTTLSEAVKRIKADDLLVEL